ncbi:putative oxidoreductase YjmC [Posidoniimonas polymericola]|uniref:Putative oxidoreductase YjmC n=1 Tax=Posidoniimonas polymericola TaxID=2528002 RepID=A0A5C5XX66_9BACT|nr:Ldh family oxidoreductase [Posidoniimonas polymericola]TWT66943.1 putative oxidoreductase YjmC [Posidoniimonas polymericola]
MRYSQHYLRQFTEQVFLKAGLSPREATCSAENLLTAELRGHGSHGLSRLRTYAKRVTTGVVAAGVEPQIESETGGSLLINGRNAMGAAVGTYAMEKCIAKARRHGSCFAAVGGGNHFGIAAYYTMKAAEAGMIGLAMSNAPASIVPTGGMAPMLGTNPLSIAIPAGARAPLVLDMASSVVAQGKVILALKEGASSIPEGWAVDQRGIPTTDPAEAMRGAMLPFGGPKGYALALIIDILCSSLSGALSSPNIRSYWKDFERPQDLGFFMGVWDISSFLPLAVFEQRTAALLDEMKSCPPAPGVEEVLIPGELEHRHSEAAKTQGILLPDAVVEDLNCLANDFGIAPPAALEHAEVA